MGWVDPWVGLEIRVTQNGPMDISALCCDDISTRRTVPEGGGGGGGIVERVFRGADCRTLSLSLSKTRFETGSWTK